MTGLERIISEIEEEAKKSSEEIIQNANKEAEKIKAEAASGAEKEAEKIKAEAAGTAKSVYDRAVSAAELEYRNAVLAKKREILDSVLEKTKQRLENFSEEQYFGAILSLARQYAHIGESGEILFNARDLKRLPKDAEDELLSLNLKVSKEPFPCGGGCVLSYGDIEEKCTFDALVESERDSLCDIITKIVF